ncbi:MAG: TIGR03085 family protein [Pseudonocardiaceae bacterium]|nr:TIGR03085 family protein [Pseudonocardiaceae bacterium]
MGPSGDVAAAERRELSALLEQVGPDASTLCAGWTARDLAAHLVIRERRPDAAPGLLVSALSGWTARVQRGATRRQWEDLVALVRDGPPSWSPLGMFDAANAVEFFVHHEDVRRGREDATPRQQDPGRDAVLWDVLGSAARLSYRNSPVGVVLRREDGREQVARTGPRTVTLVGEPGELLLHAYGRDAVTLQFTGEPTDIATVQGSPRGI